MLLLLLLGKLILTVGATVQIEMFKNQTKAATLSEKAIVPQAVQDYCAYKGLSTYCTCFIQSIYRT